MAKKLTSRELGIPSGYRITTATTDNIVMVAIRRTFGEKMMKLAWREADLIMCISSQLYDTDDMREYEEVMMRLAKNHLLVDHGNVTVLNNHVEVKLPSTTDTITLGNTDTWGARNKGMTVYRHFENYLNNIPRAEFHTNHHFEINKESENYSQHYRWVNNFCVMLEPRNEKAQVHGGSVHEHLSKPLMKTIAKHYKAVTKLKAEIEKKDTLIRSILATYGSAVSLCNAAPEFIEWINDASIFNSKGRKCTDMSTADMIAQLRKG